MKTASDLRKLLESIDRRGYPAYKDTRGSYAFEGFTLAIEHVQSDPFAPPSRLSVLVPGREAGFPAEWVREGHRRVALQDRLTRLFSRKAGSDHSGGGSGKSGLILVSRCGAQVLERTACFIDPGDGSVLVRFAAGFPAHGRTIDAGALIRMLFQFLPGAVRECLCCRSLPRRELEALMDLADDQRALREALPGLGLCAFVANGAVLPRESGVSQRPMRGAVPFQSPPSMEVAVSLPHAGEIRGMGIRKGVTLIVGGGFHGKSTLLRALEMGVYNHVAGDGRELVVTDPSAVKLRAEDGRCIQGTDISLLIGRLPGGRDTSSFVTQDASGSTSQAANLVEAWEAGCTTFLIDEDTCATNFMIRDELMQRVVRREQEPILPFIERVRALYDQAGISTILVAGSSGLFFHVADTVVQMEAYRPREITSLAKAEAAAFPPPETPQGDWRTPNFHRCPKPDPQFRDGRAKVKARGREALSVEHETIDLSSVEQLADPEQTAALGYCYSYAQRHLFDGRRTLRQVVELLEEKIRREGLCSLCEGPYLPVDLAVPRAQEILACLSRSRGLQL